MPRLLDVRRKFVASDSRMVVQNERELAVSKFVTSLCKIFAHLSLILFVEIFGWVVQGSNEIFTFV